VERGARTGSDGEPSPHVPPLRAGALLALLADHQVQFVIIGGFALAAHGVVRATKDIDIVPAPSKRNLARLAAALATLEAEPLLADDFEPNELGLEPNQEGLAFGGNTAMRTRLGRLDVMQQVDGIKAYESLHSRSVVHEVEGAGRFRFASVDDLIAMKSVAGRPQDLIDVTSLERARRAGP
jgi:hypothetical protein